MAGPSQSKPKGQEKKICCSIFVAFLVATLGVVCFVYSSVIVYKPSWKILQANFSTVQKCTTIETKRHLAGPKACDNWSSCEEWCLSMSEESCSHVWVSVRKPGKKIIVAFEKIFQHTCSTLNDIKYEDCSKKPNTCTRNITTHVLCSGGKCKNLDKAYKCKQNHALRHLKNIDVCNCTSTNSDAENVYTCKECWNLCHKNNQCFDTSTRWDAPKIGTDNWGKPKEKYYWCFMGKCSQSTVENCSRRCDDITVDMSTFNVVLLIGETFFAISTTDFNIQGDQNVHVRKEQLAVSTCSDIQKQPGNILLALDCFDGIFLQKNMFKAKTKFSFLMEKYYEKQGILITNIPNSDSLILSQRAKLKVNLHGCVNTLNNECNSFFEKYGAKDGRNKTAKAIFDCFYDLKNPDVALIYFNKRETLSKLVILLSVPVAMTVLSCMYLCACNRLVLVGEDGHMFMYICSKNKNSKK